MDDEIYKETEKEVKQSEQATCALIGDCFLSIQSEEQISPLTSYDKQRLDKLISDLPEAFEKEDSNELVEIFAELNEALKFNLKETIDTIYTEQFADFIGKTYSKLAGTPFIIEITRFIGNILLGPKEISDIFLHRLYSQIVF